MWPKKPATDVQSERSAMLIQHNKVKKSNIKKKEEKFLYSNKNCQETKKPKKLKNTMQSVTNTEDMQSSKPEIQR